MRARFQSPLFLLLVLSILGVSMSCRIARADSTLLFQNLALLQRSFRVEDPRVDSAINNDGPKGLAAADLDGDGNVDLVAANSDGTLAVLFGNPVGGFEGVRHLLAGDARGLRDVIVCDLENDGRREVVAAHPFEGQLYIFTMSGGPGSRTLFLSRKIATWKGARSVAAGDFDGDGKLDLAVAGAGEVFREYRRNNIGQYIPFPPPFGIDPVAYTDESARPVFSMQVWRLPGEGRDRLVLTHANASRIWFLVSPGLGQPLEIDPNQSPRSLLVNEEVYDLGVGFITAQSKITNHPDILTASTYSGEILLREYPYKRTPTHRIPMPGAPRGLNVSDVNNDGWPDLLVAARTGNSVSLFLNNKGTVALSSVGAAGGSPRDVVSADFNRDGYKDAAVINATSADITLHIVGGATGWFMQNPLVQSIAGEGSHPFIQDLDGNGRKEVCYLTPATGDLTIQGIGTDRKWSQPAKYFMGLHPETLTIADLNGDGMLDVICTTLSDAQGINVGVTYRVQLADHTLGPLIQVAAPIGVGGKLFGLVARDLNGDGRIDLAVGYDGRLALFEGTPTAIVYRRTEQLITNASTMLALDADRDGDLDLLGVSSIGDIVVFENNRQWFAGGPIRRVTTPGRYAFGTISLETADRNADGYPDLDIVSLEAITKWNGAPGLAYQHVETISTPETTSHIEVDFDRDNVVDHFALTRKHTTLEFYKGLTGPAGLSTPVYFAIPSARYLATGDLDSDGKPDLIGVGQHLWAALSGTPAPPPSPVASSLPEPAIVGVVINEILADAVDYVAPKIAPSTVDPDSVDCVEIFNGTSAAVNLSGWKLRRGTEGDNAAAADFVLPDFLLPSRGMTVVYCSDNAPKRMQAPFKLGAEGGTLLLLKADGTTSDSVTYPAQQPDISYARLFDGDPAFVLNPFPSIGNTNYDNGSAEPTVEFSGFDYRLLKLNQWRFYAKAWSPNGICSLVVHWQEISNSPTRGTGSIELIDDGLHYDGAAFDGVFGGDWDAPPPPGTAIEFYVTATDWQWESTTVPDNRSFSTPGKPIANYTMALPTVQQEWEISEALSVNEGGLTDEDGEHPSWAEVRYIGSGNGTASGLYLSDSYDPDERFDMTHLGSLFPPNARDIVFLDSTPASESAERPKHAPFKLGSKGEGVYILRKLPNGVSELVDGVNVPALPVNTAYARLGARGPFVQMAPTPYGPNAPPDGILKLLSAGSDGMEFIFAYRGGASVEASFDLMSWTTIQPWLPNIGVERTHRELVRNPQRYYRLRYSLP